MVSKQYEQVDIKKMTLKHYQLNGKRFARQQKNKTLRKAACKSRFLFLVIWLARQKPQLQKQDAKDNIYTNKKQTNNVTFRRD